MAAVRFGFGDVQQEGQLIASAQGCLSQITGNVIFQSGRLELGHAARDRDVSGGSAAAYDRRAR